MFILKPYLPFSGYPPVSLLLSLFIAFYFLSLSLTILFGYRVDDEQKRRASVIMTLSEYWLPFTSLATLLTQQPTGGRLEIRQVPVSPAEASKNHDHEKAVPAFY